MHNVCSRLFYSMFSLSSILRSAAAAFEAETTYASPLLGANYRQFKQAKTMFEGPMVTEHDRPFRSHGRKAGIMIRYTMQYMHGPVLCSLRSFYSAQVSR
ncbi:hypothetical protein C8R45DRAFT_500485 [Mycena sanguinolenta]|nr:hypothetical protein C8R45DRAFT_500485 [Mycena sanguinolenta]